ncbi:MAG TPA: stage V sporulation protein AA [Bacilli bacterium]
MADGCAPTLYIRLRKRLTGEHGKPITLGQAAQILVEPEYETPLKNIVLKTPQKRDGSFVLIDIMTVVAAIRRRFPLLVIEVIGEPQLLIEIKSPDVRGASLIKVALVGALLFFGAGLAIMNFHADVSMAEVQEKLVHMLTGKKIARPLLLQIPYSLGIGAGMILFFNHVFKKKFNEEPSPLEVEMFLYQENLRAYAIAEEFQKLPKDGKPPT